MGVVDSHATDSLAEDSFGTQANCDTETCKRELKLFNPFSFFYTWTYLSGTTGRRYKLYISTVERSYGTLLGESRNQFNG